MTIGRTKVLSTLAILLVCQGGFGQSIPSEEFRLNQRYQDHEIVQDEDIRISPYALDLTKDLAIFGAGNAMIGLGLLLSHDMDPLTEEEVVSLDPMDVSCNLSCLNWLFEGRFRESFSYRCSRRICYRSNCRIFCSCPP